MSYIFLAPHNDDETLFGAFTLIRHNPRLIVCLRSHVQQQRGTGITAEQREHETDCALAELGVTEQWHQWPYLDSTPLGELESLLIPPLVELVGPDVHVFAPCSEENGHEQHNLIGDLALDIFGHNRVTRYLTYTEGIKHSTWGHEVEHEFSWIALKLRALACYRSQIGHPSTGHHFAGDMREYVVA